MFENIDQSNHKEHRHFIFKSVPKQKEVLVANNNAFAAVRTVNALCLGTFYGIMNTYNRLFWDRFESQLKSDVNCSEDLFSYFFYIVRNMVICGVTCSALSLILSFFFFVTSPWATDQYTWVKLVATRKNVEHLNHHFNTNGTSDVAQRVLKSHHFTTRELASMPVASPESPWGTSEQHSSCHHEHHRDDGETISYEDLPHDIRDDIDEHLRNYINHATIVKYVAIIATVITIVSLMVMLWLYFQIYTIPTQYLCDDQKRRNNFNATRDSAIVFGLVGCSVVSLLNWHIHHPIITLVREFLKGKVSWTYSSGKVVSYKFSDTWISIVEKYEYYLNVVLVLLSGFVTMFVPCFIVIYFALRIETEYN
jgi:hypothetical protein